MIKAEDIVMDPVYNVMYIPKSGIGFEPTVLFSATSTHDSYVFNQRKGVTMMWVLAQRPIDRGKPRTKSVCFEVKI